MTSSPLSGGAPVVRARRVPGPPVVAVRVWLRGGSRLEEIPGQALTAGRMLAEGTSGRDWRRIAEEAEERGVSIGATAGYEVQSLALDGLAWDWEVLLDWAVELVHDSAFPERRLEWIARQTLAELESLADHPEIRAQWAFLRQLYHPHPRGRPLQGSKEGLEGLGAAACLGHHRRALGQGAIVAVAGAIDPEAVTRRVEERFAKEAGALSSQALPLPVPPIEGLEARRRVKLPAGEQAHLLLGGLTVPREDPRMAALELLSVVLGAGGGLVGRIPHRVRELEGLAYACRVTTTAGAGLEPGRLEIYVGSARDQVERCEAAVREELDRLTSEPIPAAEIDAARSFLLGREPFRRETARQWAALLAEAALYGVPVDRPRWVRDRIRAVEGGEVEAVARRFLAAERLKVTLATAG